MIIIIIHDLTSFCEMITIESIINTVSLRWNCVSAVVELPIVWNRVEV